MKFQVDFFDTINGRCTIRYSLDELQRTGPDDFAAVLAGLAKLRERQNHREPLSKAIDNGLLGFRHIGKLNNLILRLLPKADVSLPCMESATKARKSPQEAINTARARIKNWKV